MTDYYSQTHINSLFLYEIRPNKVEAMPKLCIISVFWNSVPWNNIPCIHWCKNIISMSI